jgi:hypothetical protein
MNNEITPNTAEMMKKFHVFGRAVFQVGTSPFQIGRYWFDGLADGLPFRAVFWNEDGVTIDSITDYLTEMAEEVSRFNQEFKEIMVMLPWQLAEIPCEAIWAAEVKVSLHYVMPWVLQTLMLGDQIDELVREFHQDEESRKINPPSFTCRVTSDWMKKMKIKELRRTPFEVNPNPIAFTDASSFNYPRLANFLREVHGIEGRPFRLGSGEGVTFLGRMQGTPCKLTYFEYFELTNFVEMASRLWKDSCNEKQTYFVFAVNPTSEIPMDALEFGSIVFQILPISWEVAYHVTKEIEMEKAREEYLHEIEAGDRHYSNVYSREEQERLARE